MTIYIVTGAGALVIVATTSGKTVSHISGPALFRSFAASATATVACLSARFPSDPIG